MAIPSRTTGGLPSHASLWEAFLVTLPEQRVPSYLGLGWLGFVVGTEEAMKLLQNDVTPEERFYGNRTACQDFLPGVPPFLCLWNAERQLQPKAVHLKPLLRLVGSQWSGPRPPESASEKVLSEPFSNSGSCSSAG